MFCPFCGTDNSSEQKFCRNCGAMLPVASKTGTLKPSTVSARPTTTSTSTFGSAPFVPPQPPALPKTGKSTYLRDSKSTSIEEQPSGPVAPPVAPPSVPASPPPTRLNRDYSTQMTPRPSTADLYGEQMDSSRIMEEFYETQATFNISEPRTPAIAPPPAEPPVRTIQMTSMSALSSVEEPVEEPVEEYDALATTVIPMSNSSPKPAEDVVSEEMQSTSENMELSETSTYIPTPSQIHQTDELVGEASKSSEPVAHTIAMAAQLREEMNPALEKTDELPRYKEATGDLNSDTLLLTPEAQAEKAQEAPTKVFPEREEVDEFKTVVVPQQSQGVKLPPLPQQDWQVDNFKTTVSQPVVQSSPAEAKSEKKEVSSPPPIPVPPFPSTETISATLTPPPTKKESRIVLIAAVAILLFLGASTVVAFYLWKTFSPRFQTVKVPPKQPDVTPQPPPQDPPKNPDPVPTIPEGMVLVPAGEYTIGANSGDEFSGPEHKVQLKGFYVDQTEVTNEQYAAFLKATNRAAPKGWVGGQPPGQPKEPVTGVSFSDAEAYAKWAGKRLPTEEEWEVAASGSAHNLYPWGNSWAGGRANTSENGLKKVVEAGLLKEGKSEFGAYDMCGNVWEWTTSTAIPYPGLSKKMVDDDPSRYRIIRGGSFMEKKDYSNTSYRNWVVSTQTSNALGFRCVKNAQ